MGLAFFGLSFDIAPETRLAIYTQIHQIVFHGKGGYDWHTIYNMPIWLRRFIFNEIKKYYDEESKSVENTNKNSKTVISPDGKIQSPEFLSKVNSNKTPAKYH